jgi:hypothetical protein
MLVGAIMLCGFLLSCSKGDEGEKVVQNPLAGTLWKEGGSVNYPLYMEFIDNSTVAVWGNASSRDTGTYRISGNTVTFSSLYTTGIGAETSEYLNATFTNNTLMLNYKSFGESGFQCLMYKQ